MPTPRSPSPKRPNPHVPRRTHLLPWDECTLGIHQVKLVVDAGEHTPQQWWWTDHTDCTHHLCEIATCHHLAPQQSRSRPPRSPSPKRPNPHMPRRTHVPPLFHGTNARLEYIKSNLWSMRENTSAMAVELLIIQTARITFARSPPGPSSLDVDLLVVLLQGSQSNGGGIADHADCTHHLCEITTWPIPCPTYQWTNARLEYIKPNLQQLLQLCIMLLQVFNN